MKPLFIGCAIAALAFGPALAQGRGAGLGVGLGASAGVGLGNSAVHAGGAANAEVHGPAGGADAATQVRGAADVLPQTNASDRGVLRGSRSTTQAESATANGSNAAATTTLRSGALIKNDGGATIGRVTGLVEATATQPASVVVRVGDRSVTIPQSEISASGDFLVYSGTALR